jgi:hypothetical protein
MLLLLQGLTVPGRATVGWFQPSQPQLFHHSRFPVFLLQDEQQGDPFYGFPEFGRFPGKRRVITITVTVTATICAFLNHS